MATDNLKTLSNPSGLPFSRRFNLFWRTVIARSYPRLIGQQREKSWLFFEIALPILITCSYVFVYKAIGAAPEFTGFVVLGGAMSAFWLNVLWAMSSQLYWEKQQGNLALYIAVPNSMMAILLGMALGGMLATCMRAIVIVVTGSVLFGVTYSALSLLPALAVFLLTMVALYGLGMLFASVFLLFGREAWHTSNLLQEPVYLVSGFYFPIKSLPVWVAAIGALIPVTLGLDAMRQLLFSGAALGFLPVSTETAILAALILVVMYSVVARGGPGNPLFPYMYIGNAFYIYVGSILIGISWAILADREEYGTLKYIYTAPLRLMWYLVGRGPARLIIGTVSVAVTLAIGALFLQVPIHLDTLNWPLFGAAMIVGLAGLIAGGLLLAGMSFLMARHAGFIGEAVAGALYLFTGSIFPLSVLPAVLQPIGYLVPITYWLEAIRRAILGASTASTFAAWSDAQIVGALAATTLAWGVVAVLYFRFADDRARKRGLIDWQTQY